MSGPTTQGFPCANLPLARRGSQLVLLSPPTASARPLRRPQLTPAIQQVLAQCPPSYGYRRIHALLARQGIRCNRKTVYQHLKRQAWLALPIVIAPSAPDAPTKERWPSSNPISVGLATSPPSSSGPAKNSGWPSSSIVPTAWSWPGNYRCG